MALPLMTRMLLGVLNLILKLFYTLGVLMQNHLNHVFIRCRVHNHDGAAFGREWVFTTGVLVVALPLHIVSHIARASNHVFVFCSVWRVDDVLPALNNDTTFTFELNCQDHMAIKDQLDVQSLLVTMCGMQFE